MYWVTSNTGFEIAYSKIVQCQGESLRFEFSNSRQSKSNWIAQRARCARVELSTVLHIWRLFLLVQNSYFERTAVDDKHFVTERKRP